MGEVQRVWVELGGYERSLKGMGGVGRVWVKLGGYG